jgi:hypothetical protein
MNPFEKILLGLLTAVPTVAPVFVHTGQGILILNASETLLAGILAQFAAPVVPAPPVPVA